MITEDALISADTSAVAGCLYLAGDLTVYRAAEVHAQLRGQLEKDPTLALDLDAVTEVDTAGIQVLLVADREARSRGGQLRLLRPSQAVLEVMEILNLRQLFGHMMAAAFPEEEAAAAEITADSGAPGNPDAEVADEEDENVDDDEDEGQDEEEEVAS
jgi:anti-sigma B factor antagonist